MALAEVTTPRIGDTRPAPMPSPSSLFEVEVVRVKGTGEAWKSLRTAVLVLGVDPSGRMVEWRAEVPPVVGDRFMVAITPSPVLGEGVDHG